VEQLLRLLSTIQGAHYTRAMQEPALRADARANRSRIIDAAHAVFREQGVDAEMKEIAERAGVGIATLYRNFATREDLAAAMVGEVQGCMGDHVRTALVGEDPVAGIQLILRSGFEMLDQYGYLMTVLHDAIKGPKTSHMEKYDEILAALTDLVQKGMRLGAFRQDLDAGVAAMRILTCLLPAAYQQLRRTRDLEAIVEAEIDLLLYGLSCEPSD
jgi:AcrR family transcriptional regulator